MNDLTVAAILVLICSVGAVIWGGTYIQEHHVQAFFNGPDPAFKFAGWSVFGGGIGFFIGVAMLVGGLVRGQKDSS